MSKKSALIFGVTGQDGSYLADYLLSLGYSVTGVVRRVSTRKNVYNKYNTVEADITDSTNVSRVIKLIKPDEVYNLAAQSHVAVSFEEPGHTWDVTAKGALNILEAIRNEHPTAHYFQASSSEMFGGQYTQRISLAKDGGTEVEIEKFQNELTTFSPKSPYAVAKLAAHNFTSVYREAYNIHASSGIMFNHESERRGENFVTRKITKYVASLRHYMNDVMNGVWVDNGSKVHHLCPKLKLGNIDVWRDWGHAEDYVRAMHLMVNAPYPDDYVIATGKTHSLTNFLEEAFGVLGVNWKDYTEIDDSLRRPNEVVYCKGDRSKIKTCLHWEPTIDFKTLVQRMVNNEGR